MSLIFKTFCNILLCLPLKKQRYFVAKISRIIEKTLYWAGFAMLCLCYMNLNYSINTLAPHCTTCNFFAVAAMFLHEKNNFFFSTLNVKNFVSNLHASV